MTSSSGPIIFRMSQTGSSNITPSILRRSMQSKDEKSTQPTKAEGKAQDVAKVSDPSPASAPVKSTKNGKAPFCVDNQLVESKQDMELETRIKVRTRVEFKEVQINADCICVERK